MFGYVRPALNRLSQEEKDRYQSAYCGLCHAMGKRHGFWARFTLNYDFTLLAILLQACQEEKTTTCQRCPVHPFRKPNACLMGDGMGKAADMSMILTWHKVDDDVRDHGVFTGLPYRFVRWWFYKPYQRAVQTCPEFDAQVRKGLKELGALEKIKSPRLDQVAHQFASILACTAQGWKDPRQQRILYQVFYHVGRWVYLMDGWDDLEEDRKCGRYNPLDARFHGNAKEEREYVATTCTHSIRLAVNAVGLLDLGSWTDVIENILSVGMPAVQSAVLDGRWKQEKKLRKGRNAHERSV